MLPELELNVSIQGKVLEYLANLKESGFEGDICSDYANRLVMATDNSVYQVLPESVLFPKHSRDIELILKTASKEVYQNIKFSPRGGGTGTNGQSLNDGLVVDMSRYMNHILELNLEENWARVQPGVVLDQLNQSLKEHKIFFAPTLSPSNRATLGGMVNTDACGKGSRIYGKTSNHLLELQVVLSDGSTWKSSPLKLDEKDRVKERSDFIGQIFKEVDHILVEKKDLIDRQFPKMSRFLTGYNLQKVYENPEEFNLNYILSGSEGTLAFITEMKLNLVPIPSYKKLIALKYADFDAALRAANQLVEHDPAAIETVDDKIVTLAKEDAIWHQVGHMFSEPNDDQIKAINLIECIAESEDKVETQIEALSKYVSDNLGKDGGPIGSYLAKNEQEIESLWNLRKKGVGLLGNAKGQRRPIPFVEDTAVPPEHLADYIKDFKAVLDKYGLSYGMFGHVDVGCLHVRPALDLKNPQDEILFKKISDEVVQLVQKYGGVMWAEHGKGFRSEYTPLFFGEELYQDLRKIKAAFDPSNKLNPGKIVTPYNIDEKVKKLDEVPLRGHYDRQVPERLKKEFETAMFCNGNGACFNFDPKDVMCPSSKITKDRIHSPKGRSSMLREWLRQLSIAGYDPTSLLEHIGKNREGWWRKFLNTFKLRKGGYDFSNEVYNAMSGCLSCKACSTQCPIKVDIPDFKSKFLYLYHGRYLRPIKDYFVGSVEWMTHLQGKFPSFHNRIISSPIVQKITKEWIGMVDTPSLSEPKLSELLKGSKLQPFNIDSMMKLSKEDKARSVILVQDAFSSYFEAPLVKDTIDLLNKLGFNIYLAPFLINGKPWHVKGFLRKFKSIAQKNREIMSRWNQCGIPMLGLEPSIILTYRDEYQKILNKNDQPFDVYLLQEWLVKKLEILPSIKINPYNRDLKLMGHCTEKTAVPSSGKQWQDIFKFFNLNLEIQNVGCCGMAGTYGHEREHFEESEGIYDLSWKPVVDSTPKEQLLATGFSCRSQIKRFAKERVVHPVQLLNKIL